MEILMTYVTIAVGLFWGVYALGVGFGVFRLGWKDSDAERVWKEKYGSTMTLTGAIALISAIALLILRFALR
jgi:heme/copper-type cytochrome/quinol oxidase subunit 2